MSFLDLSKFLAIFVLCFLVLSSTVYANEFATGDLYPVSDDSEVVEYIDSFELDSLESNSPELDSPELDSPELDSPELDSPELDSPELDSPELDSPELAPPELDSPELASPELDSLKSNLPELDSSSFSDSNDLSLLYEHLSTISDTSLQILNVLQYLFALLILACSLIVVFVFCLVVFYILNSFIR